MAKTVKNKKNVDIQKVTVKVETQLYRARQDIGKLKAALQSAESIIAPQRYLLYQTYKDVVLDGHLTGCIENRINMTLSRQHQFLNKDGSVNDEATKLLNTKWFYDYARYVLESPYYGFSLIQFGDLCDTGFKSASLVPRIYVKPEFHLVTDNYASVTGNNYLEDPFCYWCVGVGDDKDLGILKQASVYAIYKKNALAAWAEFCEVFGVPLRVGKTDMNDPIAVQNMQNFLKNMGMSAYAILGKNDLIEVMAQNRTDAFGVFDEMIQRCNNEMSKLVMGSTGVMDEKAHVGAAEAHREVSNRYMERDEHMLENATNLQLKPVMAYHGLVSDELTYKISDVEDLSLEARGKLEIELLKTGKYIIPAEYIQKTYGTPVEMVKEPVPVQAPVSGKPDKITNELRVLYP